MSFAVEEQSPFEVTFAAGLDKARYPELSEAGDAVLARGQTSHWTRPVAGAVPATGGEPLPG